MHFTTRPRAMRRRLGIAVLSAAALTMTVITPALANLTGSTFEGNDGNLVVDTAGNTDWANAPARVAATHRHPPGARWPRLPARLPPLKSAPAGRNELLSKRVDLYGMSSDRRVARWG